VRGWKAIGSKLNYSKIVDIQFIETEENDSLEATETEVINYSSNINADNDSKEVEDEEDNDPVEEIPMEIIKNESLTSEISDISLPIVLEEEEIITINSKIDDIPFEINTGNDETDVPMTIKSKTDENSNSEQNEGAQLGLF
jgi:hypothetical protein